MRYVVVIPQASLHGNAYARANTPPESREAWIVIPYCFEQRGKQAIGQQVLQRLDPAVVQFFETRAEAREWRRARVKHQRSNGRPGPSKAMVQEVELPTATEAA
jgi:hypothetical protein